ncbi:serine hydrolase domain-containing protein [Streptomyces sp. NPDC004721]
MSNSPRITAENWTEDLHWSFRHMDTIFPHDVIADDPARGQVLSAAPRELGAIPVPLLDRMSSVEEVLAETDTDGWMVMHDNRIIAEGYFRGMGPHSRHLLMSVSKSIVSIVAGVLVARGKLDVTRTVADYIPELADAGYGSASIRDLLDMRSGVRFSEEYLDYDSEVRLLDEVAGWAPLRPGGPTTLKELLASLVQQRKHGTAFEYRSSETDMLGWVCEAVSGQKFTDLASDVLWTRLGTRRDALLLLDREGTGLFDGGICATVGDLALFGAMIRDGGRALNGEQIVSPEWIKDIFTGAPDSAEVYAASDPARANSGGMYRSKFWFLDHRRDVACCLGIHGQMIYINRSARLVGVKTSGWPLPLDPAKADATLAMFNAISEFVSN